MLHVRALAPVGKDCSPGFWAGAALLGLKVHPLVPVREIEAKVSPLTPVDPVRTATLQDPLTPVGITNRC